MGSTKEDKTPPCAHAVAYALSDDKEKCSMHGKETDPSSKVQSQRERDSVNLENSVGFQLVQAMERGLAAKLMTEPQASERSESVDAAGAHLEEGRIAIEEEQETAPAAASFQPSAVGSTEWRIGAIHMSPSSAFTAHVDEQDNISSSHDIDALPPPDSDEPMLNATLVSEEVVVEASPALKGFQALIHNQKFKYLLGGMVIVVLAVAIPTALLAPDTVETYENVTQTVVEASECGTARTKQADYVGTINATREGFPCQRWDSQYPNAHNYDPSLFPDADLRENYCRNPDGDFRAWCVMDRPGYSQRYYCDVPYCSGEEVKHNNQECGTKAFDQSDYRGTINVTISGKPCQPWKDDFPHHHHANHPWDKPHSDLRENYCRNPGGEAMAFCYTMDSEVETEYCDVPFCEEIEYSVNNNTKANLEDNITHISDSPEVCGSPHILQADYRGHMNQTQSGRTCQRWDSQYPQEHSRTEENYPGFGLEENYCRNPDNEGQAWCYTTDPNQRWEFCEVPNCKGHDLKQCGTYDWKQTDYIGTINVTKSGIPCQPWTDQSPHFHYHLPWLEHEANLEHNYCRNPTNDKRGAWCYSSSPDVIWEHCDVPFCASEEQREQSFRCGNAKELQSDYRGDIATTESGRRCQAWSDQFPWVHAIPVDEMPWLEDNFCRNPDGKSKAWCFTEDPLQRWEHCAVPFCADELV